MKKTIFALSLCMFVVPVLAEQTKPNVQLIEGNNKVDVMIAGKLFTSYVYGSKMTKPVLVPVRTPSGVEVNRKHPLTEAEGASADHSHHVGIFFAVDKVNGTDFWRNSSPPPQIKHFKITELTSGPGRGKLSTIMHWIDNNGRIVLEEKRSMIFLVTEYENEYAIDFSMDLTAKDAKVVFDDIEEGMFAIRVSDYLRQGRDKVNLKSGQPLPKESIAGTGFYFSSNGDETAKNIWGKRARWVALQGIRQQKVVGVAILNHPASINYPTYWHVRDYGLFSANPLGQGDFQRQGSRQYRKNKVIPLRLTLGPGETAHFRFLVIVYEGIRTKEQIEERFRDFIKN
ncbi:MAG: PmoA family protein [Phycisphaerae bacterium]|nr:PmoA family protein [Phycisphaerae bacterium]